MTNLKIKDLTYFNGERIIFDATSIEITMQYNCITAPNGYGKSTLLNLINQSNPSILYNDKRLSASKIVYIKQEPLLLDNLSVLSNINFFAKPKASEIIAEIKSHFNYDMKQKVKKLSGGEKQFLYLLIQLKSEGQLYLIDEPFNNLDKDKVVIFEELIKNLPSMVLLVDHQNKITSFTKITIAQRKLKYV